MATNISLVIKGRVLQRRAAYLRRILSPEAPPAPPSDHVRRWSPGVSNRPVNQWVGRRGKAGRIARRLDPAARSWDRTSLGVRARQRIGGDVGAEEFRLLQW